MPETIDRRTWLLPTLHSYQPRWVARDVVAGLAAGAVVIPQAMAYATIAGLPVEVGLYTCMLPMAVYALLGGSRSLSISTTSTIAILTAATLSALRSDRSGEELMRDAFTLTVLVGFCLLALWLFRLGSIVEQVSPATMSGVKTGVGLTVAVSQLPALLGVGGDAQDGGFFAEVVDVTSRLGDVSAVTLAVSTASVGVLVLLRHHAPRVPGPLIVVTVTILLVAMSDVEDHGLALIAHVPSGLPTPTMPMWNDVRALLPGALAIAIMAFMETVIVARAQRQRSERPIDSQQELLANGVAALAGGLSQCMPPAGGFSQSAVNQRAGARSQLAGVTTAVLAVLVALFLGPVLEDLPEAVLASMVLVAVLGLVSPDEFLLLLRIDHAEFWVATVTAVAGLTAGLLLAVGVGVGLTLILVLREVSRSQVRAMPAESQPARALVLSLVGSIFTGNARPTQSDVLTRVLTAVERPSLVVIDASAVRRVTVPLLDALEALQDDLSREGITFVVAALAPNVLVVARRSAWFAGFERDGQVRPTVKAALTP